MRSTTRILFTAILGATIVTILALTIDLRAAPAGEPAPLLPLAQSAGEPAMLLRSEIPVMDLQPVNPFTRYTSDWWIAESEVQAWKEKYKVAVLLVLPGNAENPVYALDGNGAATSVQAMPQWRLTLYAGAFARGEAFWCPLGDAIALLRAGKTAEPVDSEQAAEIARLKRAIAAALQTLSSVE